MTNEINEQFVDAVKRGNIDDAIEALSNGADHNYITESGNNVLYLAMSKKKKAMFEWLLDVKKDGKGIDLDYVSPIGNSLIFEALKTEEYTSYLEALVLAGANTNIVNKSGITPLIYAVSHGHAEQVEILLKSPNIDVNYAMPGTKTTAFLTAAASSSGGTGLTIAQMLLDAGADINATDINGKNALINALFRTGEFMKGHEKEASRELCKFLIERGMDLDYVAPSGMTAFWMACQNIQETIKIKVNGELIEREIGREVVEMLLDRNVNTDVWHSIGMSGVSSALHSLMAYAGKRENDYDFIQRVISLGADLHAPDEDGNTPAAIGYLNPHSREITLALGGDVNSYYFAKNGDSTFIKSPVISHIILSGGDNNKELIKEMLARGAKVSFKDVPDHQGDEPIVCAIAAAAKEIFSMIMTSGQVDANELIDFSKKSEGLKLPVISLVVNGIKSKQLNTFLQQKQQLEAIKKAKEINDKNGVVSPLIDEEGFKMISEQLEQIKSLEEQMLDVNKVMFDSLIASGADVNLKDSKGMTPVFHASTPEAAQWLIAAGANINVKHDEDNLLIYSLKRNPEMAQFWDNMLSAQNPKANIDLYYQLAFVDVSGSYARSAIQEGIMKFIDDPEIKEKMKDQRFSEINTHYNINYQDDDGNSALLVATANDNAFLVNLYHKLGADINLANKNGETPLMHAIGIENVKLASYLIDNGADVFAQTVDGKTVLEFAEELGNKEIIEKVKITQNPELKEGSISGITKIRPK